MDKESLFAGRDGGGHPFIHRVEPGTRYGLDTTAGLSKTASGEHLPEVLELVESLQAQPGRVYIVNSALGAGEYVGFNLRGDWFTEEGLLHEPPGWQDIPSWNIDARRQAANWTEDVPGWGPVCWGYPTFYNAHRFAHHANQDPGKARGFILGAFYDHRMHRVILVSEIIEELCARHGSLDVYRKLENSEPVDTSMGARVPFDICSIDGKVSKTPADYDEHLNGTNPRFGIGRVLPDGRKCGMYNTHPRFFDDSFVFVGAERSAKVMANVTPMVQGTNAYTQTVYPYKPGNKIAALGDDPRQEEDKRIQEATAAAKKKLPEGTFEQKLSKLLSGQNLSAREKKAKDSLTRQDKARGMQGGKRQRDASDAFIAQQFEQEEGVPLDQFKYLRDRLDHQLEFAAGTKTAHKHAAVAKWAEMFKQLPAPTPSQVSIVRAQEGAMPSLPPECMDQMAQDPATSIRAAAHKGIVLRPEEFQQVMLGETNPEAAKKYASEKTVFASAPLDLDHGPSFDLGPEDPATMASIQSVLENSLQGRSFAPAMVRARIGAPRVEQQKFAEAHDPLLDELAQLYNSYRGGLLAAAPRWEKISSAERPMAHDLGMEERLQKTAQELSQALLYLAHWPALDLV